MIERASNVAEKVDDVFLYITALTVSFLVALTAVTVYFVVRYHRRRNPRGVDIEGNVWLETAWTVIPLILFLSMFYYGWTNYEFLRAVPGDAMRVKVLARQWSWTFVYPNGKQTGELFLPIGRPVRLDLESADVVHGFYIPAFRVKHDVVPGRKEYTWFVPTQTGSFDIECTVICGVSHSYMLSKAVILPEEAFREWYFGEAEEPPEKAVAQLAGPGDERRGALLAGSKGCLACHTVDGAKLIGPSWKGIYGRREVVGIDRHEVLVDDEYIARSIRNPHVDVVKGFLPQMPVLPVSEQEVRDIAAYLRTLK